MFLKFKNGEEYYNKIYILFNLFIAFPLVLFCYLLLLRQSKQLVPVLNNSTDRLLVLFSLLIAAGSLLFFAIKKFKRELAEQNVNEAFREKLIFYYRISKRKYSAFMLVGFMCVSGLYLTNHGVFIVAYILSVVLLSLKRPTLNGFIEDLKLSAEDEKILIDKDVIAD